MTTAQRLALVLFLMTADAAASAAASGPDYWMVRDVAPTDVLKVYEQPSPEAPAVGEIPPTGRDLRNLGCQNAPSFTAWAKMSELERQEAAKQRWCKVRYGAVEGWVNGRFLVEAGAALPADQ